MSVFKGLKQNASLTILTEKRTPPAAEVTDTYNAMGTLTR
jgi:hypothetical protein